MILRTISSRLTKLFTQYPFVTVTGPRQSGKTTLCRSAFPHLNYINLELPDVREFAQSDPRRFLSQIDRGAIIDEIQRVPELLSYLQVFADEKKLNSLFVLTGSENFALSHAISQSLAGRTGVLRLLPLSIDERRTTGASESIEDMLFAGFYPRIYDQKLEPRQAYSDYFETYIQRDVRQVGEIRNLQAFERFVRLCAGRSGQLANLNALGADAGVSHTTAQNWLSLLETSFIAFRLPPFHANIRKRLVKSPKIYFYDVGLASYLIGIERPEQISTHPMRGALFENMVVVEVLKHCFNTGQREHLSFFRDSRGLECDVLLELANQMVAIEIKSSSTITDNHFKSLNAVGDLMENVSRRLLVYGGTARQTRASVEVVPFSDLNDLLTRFEIEEEVANFAQSNMFAPPKKSDLEVLELVFFAHIRPTLDNLESALEQHIRPGFRDYRASSKIIKQGERVSGKNLLDAESWGATREKHIIIPGVELYEAHPLKLIREIELRNFVHKHNLCFTVLLEWLVDAEAVTLSVSINGDQCEELLELRHSFAQLGTRSAKIDLICSTILKAINSKIKSVRNSQAKPAPQLSKMRKSN